MSQGGFPAAALSPPLRENMALGHRSGKTYALAHLASARKVGIHLAMKCLARPNLLRQQAH